MTSSDHAQTTKTFTYPVWDVAKRQLKSSFQRKQRDGNTAQNPLTQ
ncbi:MAG TPA: hypothetical protein VGB45_14505 [Abditibacterium sp.]|jgi:hypothetical protein